MVTEYMRLSHLTTSGSLYDFNMSIFQGEVICLMGLHDSGKREVRDVLEGRIPLIDGSILVGSQHMTHYNEACAYRCGVDCIDTQSRLVGTLSIADNIFALRRGHAPWAPVFNRRLAQREAADLLRLVGVDYSPATPVNQLSLFEQQLICIAKALSHNARILIMDGLAATFNYVEQGRLKALIARLSEEKGVSFLLLDDKPNELLAAAHKVVLIKNGRDIKTFYQEDITPFNQEYISRMVVSYLAGQPQTFIDKVDHTPPVSDKVIIRLVHENRSIPIMTGHIYGFFDILWDSKDSFLQYLDGLENGHALLLDGDIPLNCQSLERLRQQGAIYIPENSADLLVETLSLTHNLAAPYYSLLSDGGVLNDRMIHRLDLDFRQQFGIPANLQDIRLLSRLKRKVLGIYRWMWRRPPILLLENPLLGLDAVSTDIMIGYLRRLVLEGAVILLTSKSIFELSQLCDFILCTQAGQFWNIYPRERFKQIKQELP